MAISNLLGAPPAGLQVLLDQVSRLGPENAVATEDAWSDKKIYPGHVFRQFQLPNWTKLLKVTSASFISMCRYTVTQHDTHLALRVRFSQQQLQAVAQLSAIVHGLAEDRMSHHAISEACVEDQVLKKIVAKAHPLS